MQQDVISSTLFQSCYENILQLHFPFIKHVHDRPAADTESRNPHFHSTSDSSSFCLFRTDVNTTLHSHPVFQEQYRKTCISLNGTWEYWFGCPTWPLSRKVHFCAYVSTWCCYSCDWAEPACIHLYVPTYSANPLVVFHCTPVCDRSRHTGTGLPSSISVFTLYHHRLLLYIQRRHRIVLRNKAGGIPATYEKRE